MPKKKSSKIPDSAERLIQARITSGFLKVREATDKHGWSYDNYIQHENGTRGFSRAAKKYAQAYKVSEAWLLTGEGKMRNDISFMQKELIDTMYSFLSKASEEEIELLIRLLSALLKKSN